ncbi:MAG: YicC family protein [Prolixibacteraceae bacterium]|nr:YicC family protein [Prolixibacteraceae bacterium]MBN2649386.1 YicC family protein [Prolixibacteraceae bacterium]
MIKSMTGYGKAECELPSKKVTIEIKSLNSKQLDINTRLPNIYKSKDLEIRKIIAEKLFRGKIDFILYFDQLGDETNSVINAPVVKNYFKQLVSVCNDLELEISERAIHTIMRLPDAVKTEHEQLDEKEWAVILSCINEAIDKLDQFRQQEGEALHTDIAEQINTIQQLKSEVEPYESERIERVKTRLTDALKELKSNIQSDENRFEQELIFYLEKLDINEEKVRLDNHCTYFLETLNDEAPGKKLAFISQEIGREINTMGSKANHAEIQKLVIGMKDALERIKEQTLNIL